MLDKNKENPIEWRERVLNSKSKSFCGAKWLNATIWLGSGSTTSCHHPPSHRIDPNEIKLNPSAIHNTKYKKLVRKQMLEGIRPKECEYCWKIEDLGPDYVSDRYYKSVIYEDVELAEAHRTDWRADVTPTQLEIAFDSNCNFACSYCNASFSTTWGKDIEKNGPYQHMKSDGAGAFTHTGEWAQPYGAKNTNNPYVEAFWEWWETDLQFNLKQLRVTGGEATMSNNFWRLIDWYVEHPDCNVALAVNSNLGVSLSKVKRLAEASHSMKNFAMFTSNESFGTHSEYIRDGLKWDSWTANVDYLLQHGKISTFHMMMTINALCLASLDKFHEYLFELREKFPNIKIDMSYNMLRFPSLQSITALPKGIREGKAKQLREWFETNKPRMWDNDIYGLERTIAYLEEVKDGHARATDSDSREHDFASFYKQYDKRRGKSFEQTFADWPELVQWYASIETEEIPSTEITVGDANEWGKPMYDELMQQAKDEGLI